MDQKAMSVARLVDLVTTVALIGAVVYVFYALPARATGSSDDDAIGRMAPSIPGISYSQYKHTLVLSVHSSCRFCADSMPFYKTLATRRGSEPSFRIVAVSTEDRGRLTKYFSDHHVSVDDAVQIEASLWADYLRTPTVLIVDQADKIVGRWTGRLPSAREAEVVAMLGIQ
jgi:hypothetical protein